jgi:hypothetical protein
MGLRCPAGGYWLESFSSFVFQVIDKAEYRTMAAQSLVQLLSKLPCGEYATFIAWLYKYSRSSKVGDVLPHILGPSSVNHCGQPDPNAEGFFFLLLTPA